ncbi:MAG: CBS domain-containing protein [Methanobacteriota archaeon]
MDEEKELLVGDAMTRGVICVDIGDNVKSVAEVMTKNDISSVIVTEKGDGVGIVTERDITTKIVAGGKDPKMVSVEEIMTRPLITVKPDTSIDDAARIMRDRDIRRLIVEDKDKIMGVLSEFDIVRIEPALHLLIREKSKWNIAEKFFEGAGSVSGSCEECENYSENLRVIDGRMLCDDCLSE